MAADVLIRDVFGSCSFVERCSSRANWQACSDFILTGKHSAFLPPHWKCQCRGATRATVIETWRRDGQWLIRAVNTFLSNFKEGATSNLLHAIALICIIVAIANVSMWQVPFFSCVYQRNLFETYLPSKTRVTKYQNLSGRSKWNCSQGSQALTWHHVMTPVITYWLLSFATGKLASGGS